MFTLGVDETVPARTRGAHAVAPNAVNDDEIVKDVVVGTVHA